VDREVGHLREGLLAIGGPMSVGDEAVRLLTMCSCHIRSVSVITIDEERTTKK
jgi:hypothetical protein